jgi:hypothetical protein
LKKLSFRHLLLLFLTIIISLIGYYAYPIGIQQVFSHTDNVEKIYITYHSQGEVTRYQIQIDQENEFTEMINILDSVTYTREYKNKYKGTTSRLILMDIFYRNGDGVSGNYSIDITEDGYIITINKLFQMKEDSEVVFKNLFEWIKNKGTTIEY